jgi:hypothetical protein
MMRFLEASIETSHTLIAGIFIDGFFCLSPFYISSTSDGLWGQVFILNFKKTGLLISL